MGMPQHASQGEGAAHFGGGSAQYPETSSAAGEGEEREVGGGRDRERAETKREGGKNKWDGVRWAHFPPE